MSSYLDGLRQIIAVNELNIGGENPEVEDGDEDFTDPEDSPAPAAEESSDDGDENFMDDEEGGDDQPAPEPEGEDQPAADDGGEEQEGDENFMDDEEGGDDTGETPDDTEGDEGSDGDENFMDGDEGGEDTGEEGDTSEGEGEEGSDEEGGEDDDYDISAIEDEMFSSLTPEQIAIKNHELKQQFIQLYSMIGSTLVRINDISKSNNNTNTLNFITTKLLELREMIDYNITTAYGTRTYIENQIIYQQCIGTLNALVEIINNIPKLDDINTDNEDDVENNDKGEPVETDDDGTETLDISDSSMSTYQEESAKVENDSDFNILF